MRSSIVKALLVVSALVAGCSSDRSPSGDSDGGTGGTDAGRTMRADAGFRHDAGGASGEDGGGIVFEDAGTEPLVDAGTMVVDMDAGPADIDGGPAAVDGGPAISVGSMDIAMARAALDGTTSIVLHDVVVTYLKPAVGTETAGFFVQADAAGPALYIDLDPATLTPSPAVGDRVRFTVTRMATAATQRRATELTDFTVTGAGAADVSEIAQLLDEATDLPANLDAYESELFAGTITIDEPFASAGAGHVAARFTSEALAAADDNMRFRVPAEVQDLYDLGAGCLIDFGYTPLWRFNAIAQPSVWSYEDFAATCDPPRLLNAFSSSPTTVVLTFDRHIDPDTDFSTNPISFTGGLTVMSARVEGRTIVVTTSMQMPTTMYTVTVSDTIADTLFDTLAEPAMASFTTPAVGTAPRLVINEVDYDNPSTDTAEFIEIFNAGTADANLSAVQVILINGATDGTGTVYSGGSTITLSGTLPPNSYAVLHTMGMTLPESSAGRLVIGFPQAPGSSGWIQNGARDGIVLLDTGTGTVLDKLSYEGAITMATVPGVTGTISLVETTAATALDDGTAATGSLVRIPNGADTNDASADWRYTTTATIGAPNMLTPVP